MLLSALTTLSSRLIPSVSFTPRNMRGATSSRALGTIPRMPHRRTCAAKAMASFLDPKGEAARAFDALRVELFNQHPAARNLLFTSPDVGDGKSVCALNLSIALAQAGKSVLLLDANVRRPALQALLDAGCGRGISDAADSPADMLWAVHASDISGLSVLFAGAAQANSREVLAHPFWRALLTDLAWRYDHVIFDAPALTEMPESDPFGGMCDTALLVVRTSAAYSDDVARLKTLGAANNGVIINGARS